MIGITKRQKRLLIAVVQSSRAGECRSSLSDLARRIGLSPTSRGLIHERLHILRERGYMIHAGHGRWCPADAAYSAVMPAGAVRGPDVEIEGKRHQSFVFGEAGQ